MTATTVATSLERKHTRGATLRIAYHITRHTTAITFAWWEVWPFFIMGIHLHPTWYALPLLLTIISADYRRELGINIRTTYSHAVTFTCQLRALQIWRQPKVEQVTFGEFVGWKTTAKLIARHRHRAVPFQTLALTVRRPDTEGGHKWLDQFGEWAKRKYRYPDVKAVTDPTDPNRDIIILRTRLIPDHVPVDD